MVFSIPSFLGVGDRYKPPKDERGSGPTILVPHTKTGHNPDALFDKEVRSLAFGDPYRPRQLPKDEEDAAEGGESTKEGGEAAAAATTATTKSQPKNVNTAPFLIVGPAKRGEGLGSYYGTIEGKPTVHLPNNIDPTRGGMVATRKKGAAHGEGEGGDAAEGTAAAPAAISTRAIYTSPGKLGTYGFAKLGISDIGTDYIATFYDQGRINAKREKAEWKAKMPSVAFKPTGRKGYTFDEGATTGVSQVFVMTKPFPSKPQPNAEAHFRIEKPWKPAGYVVPHLSNGIEYMEDPYDGFDPRAGPSKTKKFPTEKVFKPTGSGDQFWYTKSVVFRGLRE